MDLIDANNRQMECCIKMDYNEAKLRLKDHFMIHNDGRPTPHLDEAVRMAYEALEKQIPKKPELWHNQPYPPEWVDDDWGYRCPACGNEDIDYPEHHCRCGQALDWSEVE